MVREMGGGELKGRGEPELVSKLVNNKVVPRDLASQIKSCRLFSCPSATVMRLKLC